MNIAFIIFIILLFITVLSRPEEKSPRYFYQDWYHDACKEFGDDYTYPQPTCRSIMQADGTIVREETHYKPVRLSTRYIGDKLEPWFMEILRVDGGRDQFIERKFF